MYIAGQESLLTLLYGKAQNPVLLCDCFSQVIIGGKDKKKKEKQQQKGLIEKKAWHGNAKLDEEYISYSKSEGNNMDKPLPGKSATLP